MSQQYQKQKEKWFNAGKSQATKEILEEVDKIIEQWRNDLFRTSDNEYFYAELSQEDWNELKQQLKKLGEE